MDVHTPEKRSFNMSRIKGRDTKPEILIRKWLWAQGYRYRLHWKKLPGKPDIAFPGKKKAIFIHGCFWHGHMCKTFRWPKTNEEFWKKKIQKNMRRDREIQEKLQTDSWKCLIIWECRLKTTPDNEKHKILLFLNGT